jgi:hypothetical protein
MPQLLVVKKHHAGSINARLRPIPQTRKNRSPFHVAAEKLRDVEHAEHVGIDHERAALIVHELRRHEAEHGEGLKIIAIPLALKAVAQI